MNGFRNTTLGSCELIQLISKGAMGEIYLARQPLLNRMVAVKVIQAGFEQNTDFLRRFKQEARALAALDHPHIVPVYEYGYQDDHAYLVMPYISGGTLKGCLNGGSLTLVEALHLLEQLAAALDFAHQHAIIHRDIKPANVLLREDNWPLLADFGVAKLLNKTGQSTNGHVGTPLYMAPEQWLGQTINAQTDIYALGVLFYELLTGTPPFTGRDWGSIMRQHLQDTPEPVSNRNASVPAELGPVIQQAIAKEPSQRYTTARAFAQAAKQSIEQTTLLASPNWYRAPSPEVQTDAGTDQAMIQTELITRASTHMSLSAYGTFRVDQGIKARKWSETPQLLAEWNNLYTAVDTIGLLPSSPNYIISSAFGTLSFWKRGSPQPVIELPGHQRTIWAMAITYDGKTLITGSWDRSIRLWDIDQRRLLRTIIGHGDIILSITLAMQDKVLLSGSRDGTIRSWELPAGRQLRSIRHPAGPVSSLLYISENDSLVAGGENGSVSLWSLKSGLNIWKISVDGAGQVRKLLDIDGQRLLCMTQTEKFVMLDRNTGAILSSPALLTQQPDNSAAIESGILSIDKSGILSYWSGKNDQQKRLIQAHRGRVPAMAVLPQSGLVATGGEDHSMKIWEFA